MLLTSYFVSSYILQTRMGNLQTGSYFLNYMSHFFQHFHNGSKVLKVDKWIIKKNQLYRPSILNFTYQPVISNL